MDELGRVYGKPLIRGIDASPEQALKRVKASILRRLRDKLFQSTFSERAKKAFAKSISIKVNKSSLLIIASHPAFAIHLRGRKNNQMRWLTKSAVPIPIITEEGELIFRTASPKSMADGKWVHPGSTPLDIIDQIKKEAKEAVRKSLVAEIRKIATDASKQASRKKIRA